MPHRARAAKTSAISLLSQSKTIPSPKHTRSNTSKNSSPTRRLASLTAATLLQYCTNILSPSSNKNQQKTAKRKVRSTNTSPMSRNNQKKKKTKQSQISIRPSRRCTKSKILTQQKRQISNTSSKSDSKPPQIELTFPPRSRREASSHASAMIMQQNEIERSRFNYSLNNERSRPVNRPRRTKSTVINIVETPVDILPEQSFKFNIPLIPLLPPHAVINESAQSSTSVTTKSIHLLLTEATLAEHDRFHGTTKHNNLIKWTQELALHGRFSPPVSEHELSLESTTASLPTKGLTDIFDSDPRHSLITNNITTPTFPVDLRSLYPFLSYWQHPAWTFQTQACLPDQIQLSSSHNAHQKPTIARHHTTHSSNKTKEQSISSIHKKKQALSFHLHTHHHHHIHNSKISTIPLSPEKSSTLNEQLVETQTKIEDISTTTENEALNLTIKHLSTDKKTTRRKSSPVKRRVNSGSKSSSAIKTTGNNQSISPSNHPQRKTITTISPPVSDIPSANGDLPVGGGDGNHKSSRRVYNRRSVSANTTTIVSTADKSSRGRRTNSASTIPIRSKSSINRKRSYSPVSISLSVSNNLRKKPKISHWVLFGKSERKLVSLDADKPPVYRKCYSSIRHIKEKDIIKSNDCVILRPETASRKGVTPYLAKVKWFWEEPLSGEIQMSIIWYYHPEHAELSSRVKERFLPNELLASKYWDCVNVACIEDKCYVLNINEYNRYCLREKSANLFEHSEPVGQLKSLLNKNTPTVHHRPLPAKNVGNQNIFFCRYVYDYRAKRILKNPLMTTTPVTTTSTM